MEVILLCNRKEASMSEKAKKQIRRIYGIALSALLIVTGILLMAACVKVYKIGNRPFTPENISMEFKKIAPIVWITVGAVILGGILALVFPKEQGKLRAVTDKRITLARLLERLGEENLAKDDLEKLKNEKKKRLIFRFSAILLSVLATVPALIYALNLKNFSADYNESVLLACLWILPSFCIVAGISLVYTILENASVARSLACVKAAFSASRGKPLSTPIEKQVRSYSKAVLSIRISLAAVALVFIALGVSNGGMADVLAKAIAICTECIGLG